MERGNRRLNYLETYHYAYMCSVRGHQNLRFYTFFFSIFVYSNFSQINFLRYPDFVRNRLNHAIDKNIKS